MSVSLWTVILLLSTLAVSYGQQTDTQYDCNSQETCTACIRTPNCAWCTEARNDSNSMEQCVNLKNFDHTQQGRWCNREKIVNRITNANFTRNDSLNTAEEHPIQIQPQVIKLALRRGEKYKFTLRYRQAKDHPVDLYFVADLSYSMGRFWNQLSRLGGKIVRAMEGLTSNFRLGFGGFVDKTVAPMVSDKPSWDGYKHFSFKNHMPLAADATEFVNKVKAAKKSGNSDDPEGGFDGIMQAMVCDEKIGWRPDARHLLVFVTDDSPHIAGDGRFAGLPEPNDMECHLDKTGYYTHDDLQDYPSIGQIKLTANEHNINIIFVVPEGFKKEYSGIQSMIPGSSVGILSKDSDNIVELISSHYKNLIKSLTMTSNSTSNFLNIKYFSRCLNESQELQQTNRCDGIHSNNTVDFIVEMEVGRRLPENEKDWRQTVEIKPEGINEGVIVEVEMICGCQCSRDAVKTTQCNNRGILDCGVCSCDRGSFGKFCQCTGDLTRDDIDKLSENCRVNNSSDFCNGHGRCICGSCICDKMRNSEERFYGKFCQCDDFSCRTSSNGKPCGGNGRCKCGKCICNAGWDGPTCECRDDKSMCRPPGDNSKICSGAGKCECGRCVCDKEMKRNGRFCEDCSSCPSQRCAEFKNCVECKVHKSGKIFEEDHNCWKCFSIAAVDEIEEDPDKINPEEHVCRVAGNDGSTFVFSYTYADGDDKNPTILAKKNKDFPLLSNFVAASLGVVLLTLLLGFLILVIWKVATHVHDKREFEKFLKDRSNTSWGNSGNPLYRNPVMTVRNPMIDSAPGNEEL